MEGPGGVRGSPRCVRTLLAARLYVLKNSINWVTSEASGRRPERVREASRRRSGGVREASGAARELPEKAPKLCPKGVRGKIGPAP